MPVQKTKYLVIGAGISGLSFAERLKDTDYLICEADAEPGGYCKTITQGGFVWDYSGHFFHFRDPEIEKYLVSRMGPGEVLKIKKESRIYYANGFIDFPFQKNIHQLPKNEFIDCLVDLYFKESRSDTDSSFESMLYEKFGQSIAEKFLVPYNEKLYATKLSNLDPGAMGRFFPYADLDSIIANFRQSDNQSYNTTFTYPRGGAIQYVNALLSGVVPERVLLSEPVETIDTHARRARTSKREIEYEYLISSAPLDSLLKMCGFRFDDSIFTCNKVLVFNLGFSEKGPKGVHWIYFPQRELSFYRVGFYDNIFDSDRMSLYVEVGYPRNELLDDSKISQVRQRVLSDLRSTGIQKGQELLEHAHVVLDPAYVHITERSNREVAEYKHLLAALGVYSTGRYGSWTYCSIEDNIKEARLLADRFNRLSAEIP